MYPVLYSFRRCPYAIRARLAIKYAGQSVLLREVLLADKPAEMLACSPKATVPVLVLPDGQVIDESRDIMHWALSIHDPDHWLLFDHDRQQQAHELMDINDGIFKQHLDHYKYADRFPEHPTEYYRQQAEVFLQQLDRWLVQSRYLLGDKLSMVDVAIFPFIRQFASVDRCWFDGSVYQHLRHWLDELLDWPLFREVMHKYPRWNCVDDDVLF